MSSGSNNSKFSSGYLCEQGSGHSPFLTCPRRKRRPGQSHCLKGQTQRTSCQLKCNGLGNHRQERSDISFYQLLAKSCGHQVSCFIDKLEYNPKGVKYWMENVIGITSGFKMPPVPLLVLDGIFKQPTDFYWTWSLVSTTCKWHIFS